MIDPFLQQMNLQIAIEAAKQRHRVISVRQSDMTVHAFIHHYLLRVILYCLINVSTSFSEAFICFSNFSYFFCSKVGQVMFLKTFAFPTSIKHQQDHPVVASPIASAV